MSRIPRAELEAVEERAAGYCELCGWPALRVEYHHRDARGMGGTRDEEKRRLEVDVAVNLLRAHPRCHAWAHAHPRQARERGWILLDGTDPASVRVIADPICR